MTCRSWRSGVAIACLKFGLRSLLLFALLCKTLATIFGDFTRQFALLAGNIMLQNQSIQIHEATNRKLDTIYTLRLPYWKKHILISFLNKVGLIHSHSLHVNLF